MTIAIKPNGSSTQDIKTRAVKPNGSSTEDIKTRVQLDFAPAQMERLNWLMEACSLETRKELINTALSLLEWTVKEVRKGRTIASVNQEAKSILELSMPALADAARNVPKLRDVVDA